MSITTRMELEKKPQVGQDEKIFLKNQRSSIFLMVMYDSCDCYST